ncbi:hypothetical protein F511_43977 [Dorcoceras hygrometricum]|uniref:Uncharacterized protein n=1 Tax=Dorcoceras hygrometricum TaxID=472368 RepID=A0A2Z7A542_9LAMI|nr:hypothetical protein F511_43977 [Dorcoceras hygrometricum]
MRTRLQPKAGSQRISTAVQQRIRSTEQQWPRVEYMGATHSSQHTAPDAEHSSTCCCPTHEMWELPTPLIVANRSQQEDEVYGSYTLVLKTSILVRTAQDNKARLNKI